MRFTREHQSGGGGCSHCGIGLASTVIQYLVIKDGGYTFFFDADIACSEYGEPPKTLYIPSASRSAVL